MSQNDSQIGGDHYKVGGEEHWDRAYRLEYDLFQYIITKWVERWKKKGGIEDLYKARHALNKYIEVVEQAEIDCRDNLAAERITGLDGPDASRMYVDQG